MTLLEQFTLSNDQAFINSVKVAFLLTAHALAETSQDDKVQGYCKLIIGDPYNEERSKMHADGVAAKIDVATPQAAEDAFIKLTVTNIFERYAKNYY